MALLKASATADALGAAFTAFGLEASITACFGRTDEVHSSPHAGSDFAFPIDAEIPCLYGGRAVFVSRAGEGGWSEIFGNSIIIDHGDGTRALYAHLRNAPLWAVGADVQAGQSVGVQGSTGYSTGDHLHLGLTTDENPWFNKDGDGGVTRLLNPLNYLEGSTVTQPAGAIPGIADQPSAREVAAHAAQYVADAALRLRREVERGAPGFVLAGYAEDVVTRATALGAATAAL